MTVYYRRGARLVAYTIVGAPALATPAARGHLVDHVKLQTLTLNGRLVVTWRRADHTCILSTVGVPATTLQRLAAAG